MKKVIEKELEKLVESPAETLNLAVEYSKKITKKIEKQKSVKEAEHFWHTLGPGLVTGAADDDPSGIATYSQVGASYGYQLLWLSVFTFPLMAVVQEMCARIALVTGRGLAANIRLHFPKKILYITTALLFAANIFNIGADLGAMAKVTQLLAPQLSFGMVAIGFTLISLLLQIFIPYKVYAKYLKWLSLILLSYIFTSFSVRLDIKQLLTHAVLPSITFSKNQIFLICAFLGTTISPYLFFWQTSQEVEEEIVVGKTTIKARMFDVKSGDIKKMRLDVWFGMFYSNLITFFIISACAVTLYANGITNIQTAAQAAQALRPIAGDYTYFLFALGIIGTGLLAIPVLAGSASYALSESFKWREGLYRKLKDAYAFYGIIILSMFIGLFINFTGLDPIKGLIYSAVINGLIAPFILILIISISNNKKVMGVRTNNLVANLLGWAITILMLFSGIATIISTVV